MSDEVSAEEAREMLDRDRIAREVYGMHGGYDGARLARTVIALHRELDVLRAQLAPLCAVHDALVAAAALPGAGASPEAMVAAVRAQGAVTVRDAAMSVADDLAGDDDEWAHELMERVACAVAKIRAGGV